MKCKIEIEIDLDKNTSIRDALRELLNTADEVLPTPLHEKLKNTLIDNYNFTPRARGVMREMCSVHELNYHKVTFKIASEHLREGHILRLRNVGSRTLKEIKEAFWSTGQLILMK